MKRMILSQLLTMAFVQLTFAQCPQYDLAPPKLSNVVVRGLAATNRGATILTYNYSVSNGATSRGCINGIDIDISMPRNCVELSNAGLTDYPRYVDRSPLRFDTTVHVIAVGIPRLPSMNGLTSVWFANFTLDGTLGWFRAIPEYRLQPGSEIEGLVLTSHGLPSIRRFVVTPSYSPKPRVEVTPENEDSLYLNAPRSSEEEDSAQTALIESMKVRGWTIGPTAPPLSFDASAWIDTLLSYTHQSADLGWLGKSRDDDCDNDEHPQDGIERNIERRLTMAQRDLQHGDSVKARRDLQMLVDKTDRIWKRGQIEEKKHEHDRGDWWQHRKDWVIMSSEAYALLKYNTEYLIDRLPERERHEGRDKKER